jgi:hypothetical protein
VSYCSGHRSANRSTAWSEGEDISRRYRDGCQVGRVIIHVGQAIDPRVHAAAVELREPQQLTEHIVKRVPIEYAICGDVDDWHAGTVRALEARRQQESCRPRSVEYEPLDPRTRFHVDRADRAWTRDAGHFPGMYVTSRSGVLAGDTCPGRVTPVTFPEGA